VGPILLITGRPGVGKTTLIRALARVLGEQAGGFYTEEIRGPQGRLGFRLVTLDGRAGPVAALRRAALLRAEPWGRRS